jgi:hypothetical protein
LLRRLLFGPWSLAGLRRLLLSPWSLAGCLTRLSFGTSGGAGSSGGARRRGTLSRGAAHLQLVFHSTNAGYSLDHLRGLFFCSFIGNAAGQFNFPFLYGRGDSGGLELCIVVDRVLNVLLELIVWNFGLRLRGRLLPLLVAGLIAGHTGIAGGSAGLLLSSCTRAILLASGRTALRSRGEATAGALSKSNADAEQDGCRQYCEFSKSHSLFCSRRCG